MIVIVSSRGHHTHLSPLNYLATSDFFTYMAALAPVQGGALGGSLQPALSYTSIMHMIL